MLTFPNFVLQAQSRWIEKATFGGTGREGAVGFSIGDKGYIGTGTDSTGATNDFWEYDPLMDSWTQKANFGGSNRYNSVGFSIGSKGYLGTGRDASGYKNDFWEYDPISNTWTRLADFGGTPRYAATGFSIGEKGYIGTGQDSGARVNDFWEFDPSFIDPISGLATGIWTEKNKIGGINGSRRAFAVGFSIENKGYIGTGTIMGRILVNDFWEYNPSNDSWTKKKNFGGIGRYSAVGFSTVSKGYIGTGYDKTSDRTDFWEYDPLTDVWMQKIDFDGTPRAISVGFSIGEKGYLGTGLDGKYKNDFWEYTPSCIPAITSQPSNQSLTYGSSAEFIVQASDAVSYQWQEDVGSGFVDITDGGIYLNTTNDTLNISLPMVEMSGYKYRCIVTGGCTPLAVSNGDATLTVAPIDLLAIPNPNQTKEYGEAEPTIFAFTYTPSLIGTDTISGEISRVAGEDVGNYKFTIGNLAAGKNYRISLDTTSSFRISPLNILIKVNEDQTKEFGTSDPNHFAFTYAPSLIGTDSISGQISRVLGENVGEYEYTLGTLSAGTNYSLSLDLKASFKITALTILIIPDSNQAKAYGSVDPTFYHYTFSPSLIGSDTFSGQLNRVKGEDVGEYTFTSGTLTAGSNYILSVITTPSFNITPVALTITAEDKEKCYDNSIYNDNYTASYSGFVNNEDISTLNGILVFGGSSSTATMAGKYSIYPSGLYSSNYIIVYINGTLVIKEAPNASMITQSGDSLISSVATGNHWYLDGVEIPGSNSEVFVKTVNGTYYTVITEGGCSSTPSNSISFAVSIKNINAESFYIYPNPSNGKFCIRVNINSKEVYDIDIYNNVGVLIWKNDNLKTNGSNIMNIDMNDPKAGMYSIVLKTKTLRTIKKILVM